MLIVEFPLWKLMMERDQKNFPPLGPSNNIPGFQRVDSTHSTNKNDQNSNNIDSDKNNESYNQSILNILEEIVDFLGLSDFWKKIIKLILPLLASLLDKLNSFVPLISSLFSF